MGEEKIFLNISCKNFKELQEKYKGFDLNGYVEKKVKHFRKKPFKSRECKIYVNEIKETLVFVNEDYKEEERKEEVKEERKDYELIWEKDLKNFKENSYEWIIDELIPIKSIVIWTGKRGTYKTFLVLNSIFCICKGLKFLGKYQTKKSKVLYLDKENGLHIITPRTSMIKEGLKINEDVDVAFICYSQLRIDINEDIEEIENLIIKNDITLLVVDTYRRAIGFDENNATDVSFLFVNQLRPLVERNNLSIILIHHDKKGSQGDEMDDIRGSSDLPNYADVILKNERKGKNIILKQLKCRARREIEPISVCVETDNTSFISFNSQGNYEEKNIEKRASEILTLWITKNKIKDFKTKQVRDIAFKEGIRKQNFYNALDLLQSNGIINKISKGVYEVIQNQL